jgi:F0F1-type ATP synthase assembly protein I
LLTGGEAWNIAILSGTLRIANANCLSFICSIHFSKRSSFDERFSFYAAAKMKIHFTIPH